MRLLPSAFGKVGEWLQHPSAEERSLGSLSLAN